MTTAPISHETEAARAEHPSRVLLIGEVPQISQALEHALQARNCMFRYAAGSADSLRQLRETPFDVVITDPATGMQETLALVAELRAIRPGIRVILLAPETTPEQVIAALQAHVFLVKMPPFRPEELAQYALEAAAVQNLRNGIEVLSANRDWVSLRVNSQRLTGERLVEFLSDLESSLPTKLRERLMMAFREILMNAIEHGAKLHPAKVVEVAAVHTQRAIVFYLRDPGAGFHWNEIPHAAISNPVTAPAAHLEVREAKGMRPGGYGILTAKGIVDELIYNERGNEVLLIKHIA